MTEIDVDLKTGNIFGLSEVFLERYFSVNKSKTSKMKTWWLIWNILVNFCTATPLRFTIGPSRSVSLCVFHIVHFWLGCLQPLGHCLIDSNHFLNMLMIVAVDSFLPIITNGPAMYASFHTQSLWRDSHVGDLRAHSPTTYFIAT